MSKRVRIAVIREATLNAKPTDTHYLAAGNLRIPRKDAVALKGTTLYYKVMVDLGEVRGGDFISGRDIPVYLTDSEPVLAFQPQLLNWVDSAEVRIESPMLDNVPVKEAPKVEAKSEVTEKRRPGRPKKVVAEPVVQEEPKPHFPVVVEEPDILPEPAEASDDENTFLIEPTGAPELDKEPEFRWDDIEDKDLVPKGAPPLDFIVEDDPDEHLIAVDKTAKYNDPEDVQKTDFSDVDTGMFDE